jgi:hypothetical protein
VFNPIEVLKEVYSWNGQFLTKPEIPAEKNNAFKHYLKS